MHSEKVISPDRNATWRGLMPSVETEFHGREAATLSRQNRRALKRRIAKYEAAEARKLARKEKRRG